MAEGLVAETAGQTELRAAIGPRADHYLGKWANSAHGGFNWAAFWLSGLWLPYRKLYRATGILYSTMLVGVAIEEAFFARCLNRRETPEWLDPVVTLVVAGVCGALGNRWYASHLTRLISEARDQSADETIRLAYLKKRGGTSLVGTVVAVMVGFVVACSFFWALEAITGS